MGIQTVVSWSTALCGGAPADLLPFNPEYFAKSLLSRRALSRVLRKERETAQAYRDAKDAHRAQKRLGVAAGKVGGEADEDGEAKEEEEEKDGDAAEEEEDEEEEAADVAEAIKEEQEDEEERIKVGSV